ncbi:hypothetical protein U14_03973 [Candidatus Moduliflexus flocculans]|uniref:Lipid A phosphate methyltransferase n=1 Tax=Candidatus Moduliflexus flocculans TaxID=1499966 RepID=A0A0S6W507_9BACT|nr:hypothetical protein U14_03973 [Candidatus Moduliflexus flocculans]
MTLRKTLEEEGNWLFQRRSYLPVFLMGIMLIGLNQFEYAGHSHFMDQFWELFCMFVAFFGLGIRAFTIGQTPKNTSGRNTSRQIADTLNTTGMYSIVRHPLYVGNFFCWLGISLFTRLWWVSFITILVFWLYYERIIFAEEEYLRRKFGEQYEQWANHVPAFIPKFSYWIPAALPFSFRNVLKREYSGLFAIIISFVVLEMFGDLAAEGRIRLDPMWMAIFSTGFLFYSILRIFRKKTRLLHANGR